MKSIVLLSGGLDSTLALAMTQANGFEVDALTIDYGQSRDRLTAAKRVAEHYGVSCTVASVDPILFGPEHTTTPARNTVLMSMAVARAEATDAGRVTIGVNADDADGYLDSRPRYIEAFRKAIERGTRNRIYIHTPLLHFTKVQVIEFAGLVHVPCD